MNSALWERGCGNSEQGEVGVGECRAVDPTVRACELIAQHKDLEVLRLRETQGTPGNPAMLVRP